MATVAFGADPPRPLLAVARRALRDSRTRTAVFVYLFAAVSYINVIGYRHTYPTLRSRQQFAHSYGDNAAIRLFYGRPHDLVSIGGYVAWRVGGTLAIFAAVWGLLAAVRAMRAEEDSGRAETVLAGLVGRSGTYLASLSAIGIGAVGLGAAMLAGLVIAGMPLASSILLALAVISAALVFVGVGAVVSQLAPTRRIAIELGAGIVAAAWLARVLADTSRDLGWLDWVTPLGWAEQVRAFAAAQSWVMVLPAATTLALLAMARRIAMSRDIGTGLIAAHESRAANFTLLGSVTAQAVRAERRSLTVWLGGVGAFALILGIVSGSVSSAGVSKSVVRALRRVGEGSILTPRGYVGFTFLLFVLAVSLFCCAQISAAHHEENEGRLEILLAGATSRRRWLGGRMLIAAAGAGGISLLAGISAWLGAVSQGVSLPFLRMLEAGANCLPVALLFLGLGSVLYALLPRAGSGGSYCLVAAAFVWQLFGSLLGVPTILLDLSPFRHVGLVPAQAFRPAAAAIMVLVGIVAALVALRMFERRDLTGG